MSDDGKDNQKKGNLAGWVGLLTAIAAILGAVGFNQFFPDIVKRYIFTSTSQPDPSPTPTLSNSPALTPTPTPTPTPPTSTPTPPTPSPAPTPTLTPLTPSLTSPQEANGLTFLWKDCKRSGSAVKCNFTVTSKSTTGFGMTAWYNAIIDSEGKSYPGSLVDIGGKSGDNNIATIEPGINYALVLTFNNIPDQVTTIPLLKLGNGIQYRNVPIAN